MWAQLQNLSGNATATNVMLFLDSRRIFGSIHVTAYWDDVLCYRACVPPAPVLSSASSNSLNVDLLPGCNTTLVWQPDATWATKTVTGLATGTPYTFKVQARYSSTYPQPTSLGAGTALAPQATRRPQLLAQRNGNGLTLTWPELPSAHLERVGSLTPPISWITDTNQVSVVGGQKSVTLTPTGSAGYLRLVLE